LWILIELFPVAQIVASIGVYPGAISIAEHFVYVASVPVFILLVLAARKVAAAVSRGGMVSIGVMRFVVVGIFLFFFLLLVRQNIYASNEFLMLHDALARDPRNARLQSSLATVYLKSGNFDKAIEYFRKATQLDVGNDAYHVALGYALTEKGELMAAAREYELIPPRKKADPILEGNKKIVYHKLLLEYEKKAEDPSASAETYFALGIFYAKLEEFDKALQAFHRALDLKPDYYDALFNIAVTAEKTGDLVLARQACERLAKDENPKNTFREIAQEHLPSLVQPAK
jgi:tetratricopeptide (TPR) repeat protein